jgi:thiamine-monophosphate kinase
MLNEFDLIRRFFMPDTDHTILAAGDDAALVAVKPGMELAVSTDALVSGQHFFQDADPYGVGCKSMAVNLSDMAAMGATPRWATLALALPSADEDWLEPFARGFIDTAKDYGVDLIGGDTTRGPLTICVQILGEVPAGKALRRSGAHAGDDLWVSGTLGDAALALAHARGGLPLDPDQLEYLRRRLDRPSPRVALGAGLLDCAHSAIDVSDGLLADAGHIAAASRVRIVIRWESIPMSSVAALHREHLVIRQAALAGGDDYELAFTAPPELRAQIGKLSAKAGVAVTRIGTVEAGSGVMVIDESGAPMALPEGGFDHFR